MYSIDKIGLKYIYVDLLYTILSFVELGRCACHMSMLIYFSSFYIHVTFYVQLFLHSEFDRSLEHHKIGHSLEHHEFDRDKHVLNVRTLFKYLEYSIVEFKKEEVLNSWEPFLIFYVCYLIT